MRIAYIGHTRFPTEKAHGHQIAQVCAALGKLGHEVTLVTPRVWTPITESPFAYYGVPESFRVVQLPSFDALHSPFVPRPLAFMIGMRSYRRALKTYLPSHSFALLYCRSHAVLPPLLASGIDTILELHSLPRIGRGKFVRSCDRCKRVVCLSTPMRDELVSRGVEASRVIVEGDAVDLKRFSDLPSSHPSSQEAKMDAKHTFNLPRERPIIGYVGRLKTINREKGISELLQALKILRDEGRNVMGFIVGGPEADKHQYEKQAQSLGLTDAEVRFQGEIPASEVPRALTACDVLAMPFPDLPHYRTNMSPLKMFEYMAASRPIITSDLPTIRDVLDEETAFFCRPGDARDLARAIKEALDHPDHASKKAAAAREKVTEHSWEKRMERIVGS